MKTTIAAVVLACSLFASYSRAQRGGMPPAGAPPGGRPMLPMHQPGFSQPLMTGFRHERPDQSSSSFAPWGWFGSWGWGYPGYSPSYGCGEGPQNPQVVVVAPPQSEPAPTPPPRVEPARPVTHEYKWPAADNRLGALGVVSKDGTVRLAVAMWTQDGMLHYVTKDGVAERIAIDALDHEAMRRLNAENRLPTPLPAVASAQ